MKISQIYKLNKTQHELDFVDIKPARDKAVFLDPFFISTRTQPWCIDVSRTVKSFFQYAIDLIRSEKIDEARSIFTNLNEPNETCLGMSKSKPRGRGAGDDDSRRIFESILESRAVQTGLVEDLEDTAIFIERISKDKVSDMTTNIIRKHLIDYTRDQCELWGIPLVEDVPTGFFWDAANKRWNNFHTKRLVISQKPFLLVPKMAVSFHKDYIDKQYYQHFVLNFLQDDHLQKNSQLVKTRKFSKEKYVTKKDVIDEEATFSKEFLQEFTRKHPEIFKKFRDEKTKVVKPMKNEDLEDINLSNLVDFLIDELKSIQPGLDGANIYHNLIIGMFELIFYPNLGNPVKQKPINDNRKIIDILFDNAAQNGYFYRLHDIHKIFSRYVFVECKNISEDPKNPEIDQLAGRFSVNNSNFGILACRDIANNKVLIKRCQDLWKQKKELIIPISDKELIIIMEKIKSGVAHPEEEILANLQRNIIVS